MFRTTLGFILLLSLHCQEICAQSPFHYHYDTEAGLPSSEVYDVAFDDQGVAWFPTDRGLCSYNGYEFEVFTTHDGLTNNTILDFKKDPSGRIWMMTLDGSICFLDDGVIKPFQGNDSLGGVGNRKFLVQNLVWDQQGRMVFWHRKTNLNKESYYRWDPQNASLKSFTFAHLATEYPVFKLSDVSFLNLGKDLIPEYGWGQFSVISDSTILYTKGHQPTVLFWEENGPNSTVDSINFPGLIHSFYFDEEDGLWVGSSLGLYHFKDFKSHSPPTVYFEKLAISRLSRDREGNYWVSSLSDGVRCIPSFKFKYPSHQESISLTQTCLSLAKTDHFLIVGGMTGQLLVVDSTLQVQTVFNNPNDFGRYNNPHGSPTGVNYPGVTIKEKPDKDGVQFLENQTRGRHTIELNDSIRCSLSDSRIVWENTRTGEEKDFSPLTHFPRRIISALETDSCIWIGSLSGLIRLGLDPGDFKMEWDDYGILPLRERINDLKGDSLGRLFAGTSGNGLVILENGQVHVFQEKDGLSSNMINRLWIENDHTVWLATNRGVDRLVFDPEDNFRIVKLNRINSLDGLPSHFIRDIIIWKEKVWVATNSGLIYFDPEEVIKNTLPLPEVTFDEIRVNNTIYNPNSSLELDYNENNLSIGFLAISYAQPNTHPFYRYRLSGSDTSWNYTNSRRIQYPGLPSGDYLFEVGACNRLQVWSPNPARFQFSIHPHFSKAWWFQGLVFLGLTLLIGGVAYLRNRQRTLKEVQLRTLQAAKLKTKEAELAALRNQMNPHFVFNTLNAIQNFIFRKDAPKASYYLGKFAKLMRDGLEFSLQPFIPLSEELEFLHTYLELEALRFPDRFEYEIQIDEGLNPDQIELPPFLFQPILENAIKHGFKGINYKGKLMIHIAGVSNQDITVTIQDNGSGIPQKVTSKRSPSLYPSRGLQIVQNHIELINNNIGGASFTFRNRPSGMGTESIFIFSF